MDPQTVQEIKPLVIRTSEGRILDVSLMSPKSHSKSIERDELWHLHRQTGRTLPYSERVDLQELKARENWYEAVVIVASGETTEQSGAGQTSGHSSGPTAAGQDAAELETPAALRQTSQTYQHHASKEAEDQGGCGQVLERLEAIVEERRQTMPEGSYTTHLFASGAEKIRKKAGEEAVELILASSRDQIVYEAADLLYHMCVLLVSEGISYGEVCSELQERHATE